MSKSTLRVRAREHGPALLEALERLLTLPQNQDSTDPKLYDTIRRAQRLVQKLRGPPKA